MYEAHANYSLPYGYNTREIANSSWVNQGDYFVYTFSLQSNTSEQKRLTNVLFHHVSGALEPIEIRAANARNGSCSAPDGAKTVNCSLAYSFTGGSSPGPVEMLVKIIGTPEQTTTSSQFSITTDTGTTQCANWLQIHPGQAKANPITWETPFVRLVAGNFAIRIGKQSFYGTGPVLVRSNPGIDYTTLEALWQENGVEMRMFLYFRKIDTGTKWELYEIRTYNGQTRGDWIYYRTVNGETLQAPVGEARGAEQLRFIPTTGNYDAEIICEYCSLEAFLPPNLPISPYGYSLQALIGLPKDEEITVSTDPMTGYGVNVLLRKQGQIVTDQSPFRYEWSTESPGIVQVTPSAIATDSTTCAYGMVPPCPELHVDLAGIAPGRTGVYAKVIRATDSATIAQTGFPVRVVSASTLEQVPSPQPSTTLTPEQSELALVKQDLKRVAEELEQQKRAVSQLQKLVDRIRQFLTKFFGRIFRPSP